MISFHLNTRDFNFHHIYCFFQTGDDKGRPQYISRVITKCVNSPIVWQGGQRKSCNFMYADWVVLDFDEGLSITEAEEVFGSYHHVIGTTKSHQKPKGTGRVVCDRFRVWLKLRDRCHNIEDYVYTVKLLALRYGADSQAIDGARKFLPCTGIVSCSTGDVIDIRIKPPEPIRPQSSLDNLPHKFIPKFIRDMLENGVSNGQRNYACYTVSKYLSNNGFTESEIMDLIMQSPIPSGSDCRGEVRSAVRNGVRA